MIINGNPAGNVRFWTSHLLRDDKNARAEVVEISGLLAKDLPTALREMAALGAQSRSRGNFLYQVNINPMAHERLTPQQWGEAVDTLERNLGLSGHQRVVVEHEQAGGRVHRHVIWNRVDAETLRVADMGGNYRIHAATSRELERKFGLMPTSERARPGRDRAPELWELRAAERSGVDPSALTAEITGIWRATSSGREFVEAVEARGYLVARGDRRDFCLIDKAGDAHSLARRLDGVNAAQVRARMAEVDRASLPGVAEARAMQRAKNPSAVSPVLSLPREIVRRTRQRQSDRDQHQRRAEYADALTRRHSSQDAGGGQGFYVAVSRKRLDYERPLIQAGANGNASPVWSAARIKIAGTFKAMARFFATPVSSPTAEEFTRPRRSTADASTNAAGSDAANGLSALLDAIAAEIRERTASICTSIRAEFAGKIKATRKAMPPDQGGAAVIVLQQMQRAAIKAARAAAAVEVKGRQKAARAECRRGWIKKRNTTGNSCRLSGPADC